MPHELVANLRVLPLRLDDSPRNDRRIGVLNRLPRPQRHVALQAALAGVVARHEGLSLYAGINGRPYAGGEAAAIARDVPVVAGLPCPFATATGECLIGGVPPSRSRRGPYGWLPTWVATLWAKDDYRELVRAGAVADAKVALLSRNAGLAAM